jgi:predicted acylesterase/phospholipase RssA
MPQEGEAVCFTAGAQGAAFGAGVIHAWLASDRPEPKVVAGISMGSITAAAMQRSMFERGPAATRSEASRWAWFQAYLADIIDRPLDVIWKALPDPVDFFSATTPVRDLSCPDFLKPSERAARYQFWQLTKIGNWIAGLPITIGELGRLAILKVRRAENIPVPMLGSGPLARFWRAATFYFQAALIAIQILHNFIWKPMFTRTYAQFVSDQVKLESDPINREPSLEEKPLLKAHWFSLHRWLRTLGIDVRPLFGWPIWLVAVGIALLPPAILAALAALFIFGHYIGFAILLFLLALATVLLPSGFGKQSLDKRLKKIASRIGGDGLLTPDLKKSWLDRLKNSAWRAAGIDLGLVNNYQLKRRLWNRFATSDFTATPLVVSHDPSRTNLVVVASALQKIGLNQQVSARHGSSLIDALAAACGVRPIFAPTHIKGEQVAQWIRPKDLAQFKDCPGQEFDLIDGGALRKNPLPALFNWLQENKSIAASLETASRNDPRIHVVYTVPIEPFDANLGKPEPDRIDLIEGAEVGLLLRARRDTKVEVWQTNFLSDIVNALKNAPGASIDPKLLAIYADEIAPCRELKFDNSLAPSRDESLTLAAEGCRHTLGRLYLKQINQIRGAEPFVPCADFLKHVAPERFKTACNPGLPEVCGRCTGHLEPEPPAPDSPPMIQSQFGHPSGIDREKVIREELPNLCIADRPRIAFVASGGVFRGAFHIGLIGAMQTIKMTPDLVVGASVGTLMGGALAAMRNLKSESDQLQLLARLTETFLHVDEKVALTVPVKTAVKQLGLRSRYLKLSPAKLRSVVRAGTAGDVGYAATGVPPLVVDTLSELFMIPPPETLDAASDFLAGRFAKGASKFLSLLRSRTLDRLEIRYAVIGTSLLEGAARSLFGAFNLDQRQPYIDKTTKRGTAIFCTSAYVNYRWLLVLGREALLPSAPSFRFLQAALSSSAFPAAFAARSEADVFPGGGSVTNLFCDGGTFDNLPFIPAISLLKDTQKAAATASEARQPSGAWSTQSGNRQAPAPALPGDYVEDPRVSLRRRLAAPDLIISGGFDPLPANDRRSRFASGTDVSARAARLAASVKTDSFVSMSKVVAKRLEQLADASAASDCALDRSTTDLMNKSVVAGVVSIMPTSAEHVNPTFAFSRTLGLEQKRVAVSIADGCFRTLRELAGQWRMNELAGRSLRALEAKGVLTTRVEVRETAHQDPECPYFKVTCPFRAGQTAGCRSVYEACAADPTHQALIKIAVTASE